MMTYRLSLIKFNGRAVFRTHKPGDDPVHEYVQLSLDRDRFNALGKPGHLDVVVTPAPSDAPSPLSAANPPGVIERVMALADDWEMERPATHPVSLWSPAGFAAELRRTVKGRL